MPPIANWNYLSGCWAKDSYFPCLPRVSPPLPFPNWHNLGRRELILKISYSIFHVCRECPLLSPLQIEITSALVVEEGMSQFPISAVCTECPVSWNFLSHKRRISLHLISAVCPVCPLPLSLNKWNNFKSHRWRILSVFYFHFLPRVPPFPPLLNEITSIISFLFPLFTWSACPPVPHC